MRTFWRILKWTVLLLVLYMSGILLYGTLTDWTPEPYTVVPTVFRAEAVPKDSLVTDSQLVFLSWNIGYGGLGEEESFFYDEGGFFWTELGHARTPEDHVETYLDGAEQTIATYEADFYLLQEVDTCARRSWYTDQLDSLRMRRPDYATAFAMNYKNQRVPIPIFQPWDHYGYVRGGLVSMSATIPEISERHQLPGDLSWPTRLFELDRCVLRQVFPTAAGQPLVVYNVHLAAYDKGGVVKQQQMEWLREAMLADYAAGNYVVIGGDWNQVPPGFDYAVFNPDRRTEYSQIAIGADYAPAGWQWVYDPDIATNRKCNAVYHPEQSLKSLIDFFLVSPNVQIEAVETLDQDFAFSDHQPVRIVAKLKREGESK